MAALVFPSNPGVGDEFAHFRWDGQKWVPASYRAIVGDAPATGVFGRSANAWLPVSGVERVLSLRMLGGQAKAANTWTTLNWDTVDIDTQGAWNNATKNYTPKVAGWYLFTCVTPYIEHFLMTKNAGAGSHPNQIMASRVGNGWFHTNVTVTFMNGISDYVQTSVYDPQATVGLDPSWRNELAAYLLPSW